MEEKETKAKKGTLGIVWLVAILIIFLGCTCAYVYKLNLEIKELESKSQINNTDKKNETESMTDNNVENKLITIKDNFNGETSVITENIRLEDDEKGYDFSYFLSGNKKGKILISRDGTKIKELNENKKIVSINSFENYEESSIYLLYEDGTVGKINYTDIKNKKYDIEILAKVNNVVRLEKIHWQDPTEPVGGDHSIIAVCNDGTVVVLDTISI